MDISQLRMISMYREKIEKIEASDNWNPQVNGLGSFYEGIQKSPQQICGTKFLVGTSRSISSVSGNIESAQEHGRRKCETILIAFGWDVYTNLLQDWVSQVINTFKIWSTCVENCWRICKTEAVLKHGWIFHSSELSLVLSSFLWENIGRCSTIFILCTFYHQIQILPRWVRKSDIVEHSTAYDTSWNIGIFLSSPSFTDDNSGN